MEIKINREIRNYTESMFFGLSMRQFIFSVLACGVAVGLYFILRHYFGVETLSWMCHLGAAPFALLGFVTYHGMTAEQFIQPQQKELYEAMLNCSREGVELSLTALRAFVSEEALNELSRLAAQYSDVNCTPEDIHLYLDRIARGMPVASKAAAMSGDEITQYLQSMREKKQGTLPEQD